MTKTALIEETINLGAYKLFWGIVIMAGSTITGRCDAGDC